MTILKKTFQDRILQIALVVTFISLFFARPRMADINWHTLLSIATMLILIQIFSYLHVLDFLTYKLTSTADNTRKLTAFFSLLAVVAGMFLTNDITILTLIPLYLQVAKKYDLPKILPVTLIGMGANIGAACTPWGNPHNIFVVSHHNISPLIFFKWIWPFFIASLLFLLMLEFFIPQKKIPVTPPHNLTIDWQPTGFAIAVFIFFFFGVFKIVPVALTTVAAAILALLINPSIFKKIDYSLLLTFGSFFVFVSDIQQIPAVVSLIDKTVFSEGSTYLTAIISSQVMSNVPATILVGKFATYAKALLIGSNIGGFGSPIGSMANMLVLKSFHQHGSVAYGNFYRRWQVWQIIGLIVMTLIGWLILKI
jgi:Na+/H+ antiporter NhaD/arsenite permease-like protein